LRIREPFAPTNLPMSSLLIDSAEVLVKDFACVGDAILLKVL